jgi:hypothetical protein
MAPFKLSKWYFDCVTDAGDAAIVYTGDVQWRKLRLHYSSVLETGDGGVVQRHSLRRQVSPEISGAKISWSSKPLKVDGVWEALSSAIVATIYRSSEGSIEWNCLMPLARARVGDRCGLGYAERLTMTILPWKLPIHTLRWGHFTSASDWLTWIDWRGEYSQRIVYMNGKALQCPTVEDERIEAGDEMCLSMDRSLVLRDGRLGETALSGVPGIREMFPSRLVEMVECKWCSRSRLERKGGATVEGWTIHEKVSWPQ